MANNSSIISSKTLNELKDYTFRIPLYQRPYAWNEEHIIQLLEDLKTFYKKNENNDKKYYLGNIVVSKIEENNFTDVIDGQQRLTTLFLLLKIIDIECFCLKYEIREDDEKFLENFDKDNPTETFKGNIQAILVWQNNNSDIELKVLLEKIEIAFTQIPKEVDVVKYFEVMNNRSKQLEKHQILKANFLDTLKDDKDYNYAKIWDYCSEMSIPIEYLIYYNDYKKEDRKKDKNSEDGVIKNLRKQLLTFDFDNIKSKNGKIFIQNNDSKEITIKSIIEPKNLSENDNDIKDETDFNARKEHKSIIKFPIFLIQVLKIFIASKKYEKCNFKSLDKIIVNDRYLLDYFFKDETHTEFLFKDNYELAREFILFLFKARILFDYFILKRNDKDEPEFIARENKNLLMIELLFNVSAPQYFAQDWVTVVLSYLVNNDNLKEQKFDNLDDIDKDLIKFLEDFDNELQKVRLSDKKIIDYINEKIKKLDYRQEEFKIKSLESILNQGTLTPHYWFYKLDYLLWKDYIKNKKYWKKENNSIEILENVKVDNFRLKKLNSIEHIQPQNPEQNCKNWNNDKCNIDNFGNLALISNHMNSTLTNQCFDTKKKDIEKQLSNGTIESLKMLLVYSKYKEWNEGNCQDHQKKMIEVLKNSIIKTN